MQATINDTLQYRELADIFGFDVFTSSENEIKLLADGLHMFSADGYSKTAGMSIADFIRSKYDSPEDIEQDMRDFECIRNLLNMTFNPPDVPPPRGGVRYDIQTGNWSKHGLRVDDRTGVLMPTAEHGSASWFVQDAILLSLNGWTDEEIQQQQARLKADILRESEINGDEQEIIEELEEVGTVTKLKNEITIDKKFEAVPTLQAENLVSGIWNSVKDNIFPDCLYRCFTQDGLSETCAKILQNEIFYKPETDMFYIREHSQYYKSDTGNLTFYSIRQIGRKLNDIKKEFQGEAGEALTKSLKTTTSHSGLKSIQSLMRTEPALIRMSDEIDPEGLLMTPAGSIDPCTGKLYHRKGLVFTRSTKYNPDFSGRPTEFYKFLNSLFHEENKEQTDQIIDRLLDIIAAAITGAAPQLEKFLIFSGRGGTGKQQFLELLEKVAGDYFTWMRPESLYETGSAAGDTPRSDLLRIQNSLFVGISEPSDAKLSSSLFKTLGSGEPIPCRPHHSQTVIEVRPRALFIIATNRKPYISHDDGTKRRIEVYNFEHEFHNSSERVPDIGRKIAEYEGGKILADFIRRAEAWKQRGGDLKDITESETVKEWTDNYLGWSDVIGRFLSDETYIEAGGMESVTAVYTRFAEWADRNGENRMSGRALGESLHERRIRKVKKDTGWKFAGLSLKPVKVSYDR